MRTANLTPTLFHAFSLCLVLSWALPPASPPLATLLVEGRFGRTVDAADTPEAAGRDAYSQPPLTAECWARVRSKGGFNILVASEPKESSAHWEIYTYAGSGFFSAYLPNWAPGETKSSIDVTDDRWHHLAMTFDGSRVRLYVDGKEAADQAVKPLGRLGRVRGPLTIGGLRTGQSRFGCDGLVDEVRISRGLRPPAALPTAPFETDAQTLGL